MPEVMMPRLSDTMQEGTIARWLKKPGDTIKKGDVLAEIETDKANMELESYDNGILEQIIVAEGETVPIGKTIALIGTGVGSKVQAKAAVKQEQAPTAAPVAAATHTQVQPQVESAALDGNGHRNVKVSPLARRMAEEYGIDLQQIQGTGPGGRIVRDDIEDYRDQHAVTAQQTPTPAVQSSAQTAPVSSQPAAVAPATSVTEDAEVVKISRVQSIIARRLTESKQAVPHFYVSNEVDMTALLEMRQMLNANVGQGGVKVSINDLIVKACALALEKFPDVNASFKDDQFIRHKRVNIGIAVDIPAGLVVPVIHDANIKGVRTIAREAKALIEKAKANKLTPADLDGGTFSVSNLGMMDVTNFIAVINPPQSAILAVASTRKQFVPVDGQPVLRDIMPLTLSADHRILYGAMVARFLQEVKALLQNPYDLLG